MKRFKNILGTSALVLALQGCNSEEIRTEISAILHEDAVVAETVYTPSRHGSGTSLGHTVDSEGERGLTFQVVSVDIPEKYAVVFKCQHGKFIVQGTDKRHKDLWQRFMPGQEVDVTYKEIFKSTYKDIDGDGKKDLVSRSLIDYDFLDAQLKPQQGK